MCRSKFVTDTDIVKNCHCNHVTLKIRETRAVEAQFQIKVPDPYPLVKRRTDLGVLVVLPLFRYIYYFPFDETYSLLNRGIKLN